MILSILICSIHPRQGTLRALVDSLRPQWQPGVEILTNMDRGAMRGGKSTGAKRNELVRSAVGEYVIFIDDDDSVPAYYVSELLRAAQSGADCFAINGTMTSDGNHEVRWRISRAYENVDIVENGRPMLLRKTNHITAVKRSIALLAPFPDKSNAEDKAYSEKVTALCKTEFTVEKPMYHYRYASTNKQYV